MYVRYTFAAAAAAFAAAAAVGVCIASQVCLAVDGDRPNPQLTVFKTGQKS